MKIIFLMIATVMAIFILPLPFSQYKKASDDSNDLKTYNVCVIRGNCFKPKCDMEHNSKNLKADNVCVVLGNCFKSKCDIEHNNSRNS